MEEIIENSRCITVLGDMSMDDQRVKIKICGIRTPEEADYLNRAKVEYAGCVFYEPSKRYVTFDQAAEVLDKLDKNIVRVAVTVSPDIDLARTVADLGFDILQVHKELSKDVMVSFPLPIWYACNISDKSRMAESLGFMEELSTEERSKIQGILMDAPDFGSGKTFDWDIDDVPAFRKSRRLLKAGTQSPPTKFILAGGLNADNVARGIEIFGPDIVDVSSGVEGEEGKDEEKIMRFVDAVRSRRWQ